MSRSPVIAGNWKMHLSPEETGGFFQLFRPDFSGGEAPEILVFPPFVSVFAALVAVPAEPKVQIGIQNIHWERSGAFTGEISAHLAREAGATHPLIGHSARRHLFGETNEEVAKKTRASIGAGLITVICVGETLEERKAGRLEEVLLGQLGAVLPVIKEAGGAPFLLAYEPVWAIGTGETATPEDASEAHSLLRQRLVQEFGDEAPARTRILYGGSVKPGNAAELLAAPEVEGVLVGGASLDPDSFARIAEAGVRA